MIPNRKENFICSVCHKSFNSEKILSVHSKLHADKFFNCHICYKIFKIKGKLNAHVKTHSEENVCGVCSKKFKSNDTLLKHQRKYPQVLIQEEEDLNVPEKDQMCQNKSEKSTLCTVCGKSFDNPLYLERHIEIHSEENFPCKECKKEFSTKQNLYVHMTPIN